MNAKKMKVNGAAISPVGSVRELGFHYSNDLDFSEHIIEFDASKQLCDCANISYFQRTMPQKQYYFLRAYKTFVRPIEETSTTAFNICRKKIFIVFREFRIILHAN